MKLRQITPPFPGSWTVLAEEKRKGRLPRKLQETPSKPQERPHRAPGGAKIVLRWPKKASR